MREIWDKQWEIEEIGNYLLDHYLAMLTKDNYRHFLNLVKLE